MRKINHLKLKTGEELDATPITNDLLAEKVYKAGDRVIFECEAKHSELYFKEEKELQTI